MRCLISVIFIFFLSFVFSVSAAEKIDINTASFQELQKIIWVGPVTAQKIIDARPFYALDGLIKVSGIGEKRLQDIKTQGLAWTDPELEPPKTQKSAEPMPQQMPTATSSKSSKSGLVIPVALAVAIFSGTAILVLKKKLEMG